MADETRRQKHVGWPVKQRLIDIDDSLDDHDQQLRDLRGLLLKAAFAIGAFLASTIVELFLIRKG